MSLRWQEAAVPLVIILALIGLKLVPAVAHLPLAQLAGIIAFGYAIFLALRLVQNESALEIDGWSELRSSPVEYFAVFGSALLSALLLGAVIVTGSMREIDGGQAMLAYGLAVALAFGALGVANLSLMVRTRWTHGTIEQMRAGGKRTAIAWRDVMGVKSHWRGVTIYTADRRTISFSPFQSGAAQLTAFAQRKARRNAMVAAGEAVL